MLLCLAVKTSSYVRPYVQVCSVYLSPKWNGSCKQMIYAKNILLKMTRGTNLMQRLRFIIINNSTCFRHYMPIFRSAGCVLLHMVFSTRCCGCGPKEPVCSLVHCV